MHYTSVSARLRNAFLSPAWVCFLWVGMTAGISMLATPVRFTAVSITRPVALDVGRVVFTALELVKIGLLLVFGFVALAEQDRAGGAGQR